MKEREKKLIVELEEKKVEYARLKTTKYTGITPEEGLPGTLAQNFTVILTRSI